MDYRKYINLPKELVARYRTNGAWDLFVFAVCLKNYTISSGIHPSVYAIRRILSCGKTKAERLLAAAKHNDELFYYNKEKNFLVARSFLRGIEAQEYRSGRTTFKAYAKYCIKFRLHAVEDISHKGISRELVDALLLCPVGAKQRKNDFLKSGTSKSSHSERSRALSVRKLANIAKCSISTVSRHLNRLEKDGVISSVRHEVIPVFDLDHGVALTTDKELLSRGSFQSLNKLVVRDANEYRIKCFEKVHMATNVIFNHRKRQRVNEKYSSIACFEH